MASPCIFIHFALTDTLESIHMNEYFIRYVCYEIYE